MGAHGPTDDPSRYRDPAETAAWQRKDPLLRYGIWLCAQKILTTEAQAAARQRIDDEIRAAIAVEEAAGPPPTSSLFDDVLAEPKLASRRAAGRIPARAQTGQELAKLSNARAVCVPWFNGGVTSMRAPAPPHSTLLPVAHPASFTFAVWMACAVSLS